jgi:hypothetical protein
MAIQTTYTEGMRDNSPGTIAGSDYDTITGICETADPGIGFGLAVADGTLSDKGTIIGGTTTTFKGISVKDKALAAEQDAYLPPDNMAILQRGQIWAEPAVAVNANDPVHFSGTTGILTNTGGVGPVKGARWVTSCALNGRALVYLSGYQRSNA